jgi:hypothetical protein
MSRSSSLASNRTAAASPGGLGSRDSTGSSPGLLAASKIWDPERPLSCFDQEEDEEGTEEEEEKHRTEVILPGHGPFDG